VLVPKRPIQAILDRSVEYVRLPEKRFTPKQVDSLRAARYHRDDEGRILKVTAGPIICRLRILKYERVTLDDLDDDTARHEGYPDVETMMTAFLETYQTSWTDTEGWRVRIRPDVREQVRLLTRQQGARYDENPVRGDTNHNGEPFPDAGQYTESAARALFSEPEAVDPKLVEAGAAALEARQRYQRVKLQHEKRLGAMTIGERIDRELMAQQAANRDTFQYERELNRRVEAWERRRQRDAM
jgi:hypothetical protein